MSLSEIITNSDQWYGLELQFKSFDCPRCETPHNLQFKLHLTIISASDVQGPFVGAID